MASSNAKVPDGKNENKPESETQVPEWILASRGIKLIVNNNSEEAQKLFLRYPDSLVMFAGYSFAIFMDALMSFEEEKLNVAISTLKEVEKRCATEQGWLKQVTSKVFGGVEVPQKSLADQLEAQIILADSQVCIAILTFLQQEISGYFKGGWVLRKAWRVYQKVYKEIMGLYKEYIGELHLPDPVHIGLASSESAAEHQSSSSLNWDVPETHTNGYIPHSKIPHSKSANLHKTPNGLNSKRSDTDVVCRHGFAPLKKSLSINNALSGRSKETFWGSRFSSSYNFPSISLFSSQDTVREQKIEKEVIIRLMGAVSFGYGLFQLGISLLPPSLMRLTNILGFGANRQNGIACLMYARLGVDMRAPLATLSLLWYHTIVRPFYAVDGTNVQAGAEVSRMLLRESEGEFRDSALFLFFRGRVCRLNSDIKGALQAFQQAVSNANQREIKILGLHEVGWCYLIELDYCSAENTFTYLKNTSRWSKSFYVYLAAICTGACENSAEYSLFEDLKNDSIGIVRGGQLDEFLSRRIKCCPADMNVIKDKRSVYWKLLVFEMLYLWNALPSCSRENINTIVADCSGVIDSEKDEPMVGLSKLILGSAYSVQGQFEKGVQNFRKCLEMRKNIPGNAEDAHVSAFAQYELGALLLRKAETKEEGKSLLGQIDNYSRYDFEQKLNVRVYSLLKHC